MSSIHRTITPAVVDAAEVISGTDLTIDESTLFADELDPHLSHAAAHTLSTIATFSTVGGMFCTFSTFCCFVEGDSPDITEIGE